MIQKKKFIAFVKNADLFASDVAFRENGGNRFGSVFGSLTSILIALIVASYGINKFIIMSQYNDTVFNNYTERNGLSEEEIGQDQLQFQIAFSIFEDGYDSELGKNF